MALDQLGCANGTIVVDVLIVGAGQAGMAAAHHLAKIQTTTTAVHQYPLLSLHVVEAHEHVGGRTRNVDVRTGQYNVATDHAVELGGTWLSPNHTAFLNLCRDLDIDVFRSSFDDAAKEDSVEKKELDADKDGSSVHEWPWWYWGPEYSRAETTSRSLRTIFHHSNGSLTDPPQVEHFDFCGPQELLQHMDQGTLQTLEQVGALIHETGALILSDLSWNATSPGPHWRTADRFTTAQRVLPLLQHHQIFDRDASNIIRNVIHNKNAQEPDQVGWLYNMISFRGGNSAGPDNEYRVVGGTQAVPLAIAAQLLPSQLSLGDAVDKIEVHRQDNDLQHNHALVTTRKGATFQAKTVILTGSPPALLSIHFEPPLPAVQAQLLQRMPMGTSCKCIAVYRRGPWWRSLGLSGDILAASLSPDLSVEGVPIFGQCFDTSPVASKQDQRYGVLTCFVEGRQNLYFSSLPSEEQVSLLQKFLGLSFARYLLSPQDQREAPWVPDQVYIHNWADDAHVRGAFTAYFPPGVLSVPEWWEAYRNLEKLPNVFLAGSDYHVGFGNGYMEGAVRSGQRAAELVLERLQADRNAKVATKE